MYLRLGELSFLSFEQLFGHPMWAVLCAQTQLPERSAEGGRIFIQETSEGDLQLLDVGLHPYISINLPTSLLYSGRDSRISTRRVY